MFEREGMPQTFGEKTRKQIRAYIIQYMIEHGYSPSVRDIAIGVGLRSTSTVHHHLRLMFEQGMLETDAEIGTPRAIRVPGWRFVKEER